MSNVCVDAAQLFALIGPSAPCQNSGLVDLNQLDCFAEPATIFADNEGSCTVSCSNVRKATQSGHVLLFESTEDLVCDFIPYPFVVPVIPGTSRIRRGQPHHRNQAGG